MSGDAPIDHLFRAGMWTSVSFGMGAVAYSSSRGLPISSIRVPLKYSIITATGLGGAAAGALCGGLSAVLIVGIGAAGKSVDERDKMLVNYGFSCAIMGGVVGGITGSVFGLFSNRITYHFVEAISHKVPRYILAPVTTTITLLSIYSIAKNIVSSAK